VVRRLSRGRPARGGGSTGSPDHGPFSSWSRPRAVRTARAAGRADRARPEIRPGSPARPRSRRTAAWRSESRAPGQRLWSGPRLDQAPQLRRSGDLREGCAARFLTKAAPAEGGFSVRDLLAAELRLDLNSELQFGTTFAERERGCAGVARVEKKEETPCFGPSSSSC
jgi:hypothetical protein